MACGSAHTIAWSTTKPSSAGRLPREVPMELNHLQHISMGSLRNRLMLLHHFSELVCSSLPLFDLQPRSREHVGQEPFVALDALRGVLIPSGKVRNYTCLFLREIVLHSSLRYPPSLLKFLLPFPAPPFFTHQAPFCTHQPPSPPGLSSATFLISSPTIKIQSERYDFVCLFVCLFLLL